MTAILVEPYQSAQHVAATNATSERFFADNADQIARACEAVAMRFQKHGRLLVHGCAAQQSDVAHVVVEFVHPVIVGKRALPALAIARTGGSNARLALRTLGKGGDIFMLLTDRLAAEEVSLLFAAQEMGMLTIVLSGPRGNETAPVADFRFDVPSNDPMIVQETHEMLYHVLWELVHVFFDHGTVTA